MNHTPQSKFRGDALGDEVDASLSKSKYIDTLHGTPNHVFKCHLFS